MKQTVTIPVTADYMNATSYECSFGDHTPNAKTLAALEEAVYIEDDPLVKAYSDTDELFADLDAACIK
jgi:uncharacterized protein YrrD